jgi:hypothetical protein
MSIKDGFVEAGTIDLTSGRFSVDTPNGMVFDDTALAAINYAVANVTPHYDPRIEIALSDLVQVVR